MTQPPAIDPEHALATLSASADGICMIDLAGVVRLFNAAAQTITGWPATAVIGRGAVETLLPGEHHGALPCHAACPLHGGGASASSGSPLRTVLRRPGGDFVPVVLSCAPVRHAGGELAGFVQVFRDASSDQEEQRAKDVFLAEISHELRTPLSAISACTEMLLADTRDIDDENLHLLRMIERNTRRLEGMIGNMLNAASIQSGHLVVTPRMVDLSSIVEEAASFVEPFLAAKRQDLSCQDTGSLRVLADRRRIVDVVVNLLTNASKYGPVASVIDLRVAPSETSVRVTVTDQGPGIPEDDQMRIFERFYRAHGNTSTHGVGLGLAIVRNIIERHGGQVGLESRPGEGTSVWFTLPTSRAST